MLDAAGSLAAIAVLVVAGVVMARRGWLGEAAVQGLKVLITNVTLPLLLLFRTSEQSLAHVITGELIAVEVVRALVGSIGLVASVPITTGLAALVVTRSRPGEVPDDLGLA